MRSHPSRAGSSASLPCWPCRSTGMTTTVLLNRAWACHAAGQLTMKEPAHAREWFEESLEHFRVLGHEGGEAAALRGLMEASLLAC